jgi:hypothetical protein
MSPLVKENTHCVKDDHETALSQYSQYLDDKDANMQNLN